MKNTNHATCLLHRIHKACQYSGPIFSLTLLGVTLGSMGAAQASLIGDEVRLDLDFQSDALGEPAAGILPGPVAEVEEDGVLLIDGVLTPPADLDVEFLAGIGATSEDGLSSAVGDLFLNLEADLIEGFVSARWDLQDDNVAPLRWEYTLSDLDWVDFPAGRITDIQFSFVEGNANGTVTGCIGQSVEDCKPDNGGVSASVASSEGDFGATSLFAASNNPFTTFTDSLNWPQFFSTSFTEDSVTLALDLEPLFPIPSDFSNDDFILLAAQGDALVNFQIDIAASHRDTPIDDPVAVPEPLGVGGLVVLGSIGLGARLKKRLNARR